VLIGRAEVFAPHGLVIIGTADWPGGHLIGGVEDGAASLASDTHVVVRSRGLTGPALVSVWARAMPVLGEIVFDGRLSLPESTLHVWDRVRTTSLVSQIRAVTPRVVVRVDAPGRAARIDVGVAVGDHVRALTAAAGHALPDVQMWARDYLVPPNELDEILSDYDRPVSRLAAAILLLGRTASGGTLATSVLVEWLRRFVELSEAERLGRELAFPRDDGSAVAAARAALSRSY
jgi:hypothetical protein